MSGKMTLKQKNDFPFKKRQDNMSDTCDAPAKSPRYSRKKRIPIGQARKYHSQSSVQNKIASNKFKASTEKYNEAFVLILPDEEDCYKKSQPVSSTDIKILSKSCSKLEENVKSVPIASNVKLRLSSSFPSLNEKTLHSLRTSKSCDNFNYLEETNILFSSPNQSSTELYKSLNNSFCDIDNENIDSYAKSRCSSTSTIRERLDSQDSAFSLISIIDIKEVTACELENNLTSSNVVNQWKPHHSRSKSDMSAHSLKNEDKSAEVFSLPSSFSNKKDIRKKSIFGGQQIIVPTECFFPRPHQGQSLTSFLSSNDFNISAELDRENAHFCISEALISAIEHMKCSRLMRKVEEEADESDEEIQKLTQRIRIRRKERQREKIFHSPILLSDGRTDTTSQSASPPASSHSSDFDIESLSSEDEVEDLELSAHTDSNLSSMRENGLSLSLASLYSEADIHKAQMQNKEIENRKLQDSHSVNLSAESVALSLLRRFSERHLPKASDLQWLVSEQDAPQRLLPLPDSWPISPDVIEEEYNLSKMRLRGNLEWAPPRPQIIFNIHPYMKRKEIIEKQKYRCAGCGMKTEKDYISRFRYCEYFGKYFCQCCHSNRQAYIPGRILWKWDFTKYYVSNFAWNLLDQMLLDPLFTVQDINKNLYQKARQLDLCKHYRLQLFYLKDFIFTCRQADLIQVALKEQNSHIIYEPHTYSLSDLLQVKSGELSKILNQLVNYCTEHVKQCILCQAKGFICEICRKDHDIIFPFQIEKVVLCESCRSCFHKKCFKNIKCPRCVRIQERKKRLAECKSDDEL